MNNWLWAIVIGIALYIAIGVGAGIYMKSWKLGALWPLMIILGLFGNVQ